jgi:hypothetical protein
VSARILPLMAAGLLGACASDAGSVSRADLDFHVAGTDVGSIDTPLGWHVQLDVAELSVAAIYFRDAPSVTGTADDQGRVTAQVLGPFTLDALDANEHDVDARATAVTERAQSAELWLTEAEAGAIADALGPSVALAHLAGTAAQGDALVPFDGALIVPLTRDERAYQAYLNRRVRRVPTDFTPRAGGTLTLHVDPTHWLDGVTFDTLTPTDDTRAFNTEADAVQLRSGIAAVSGYTFEWHD